MSALFIVSLIPYSPLFYAPGWLHNEWPGTFIPVALTGFLIAGVALIVQAGARKQWWTAGGLVGALLLNVYLCVATVEWYILK